MKKIIIIGITLIMFLLLLIANSLINYDKNVSNNLELCQQEDTSKLLVEKNIISNTFTSFLYKENEKYTYKIIDCKSLKELSIDDILKKDNIEKKEKELLKLKYPKFIRENVFDKSYLIRNNEIIIYYDNSKILPKVEEDIYLTINNNEIKDYLKYNYRLDLEYTNESGYNYSGNKKSVAITFDDGPNYGKTNKILEYLKDNLYHATFFIVGERSINNKDLLISIKNNGNEIGTHTYNHKNLLKMTKEEIINDYDTMNSMYYNLFHENIKLFRPPYGSINKSIKDTLDVSYILWSVDTLDWKYHDKDYIVNYVVENINDGDIILLHDSYDTTVDAIKELLPILYSKGYQVMSVSELFKIKNKSLNNKEIYYSAK